MIQLTSKESSTAVRPIFEIFEKASFPFMRHLTEIGLRENAYKYFTEIMEGNLEAEFSTDNTFQTAVDYLPLFMKKYPFKRAFSKAVHDVDISGKENNFRVEGPIGRGLEITPKTYGTHTIICAGTGILPFVDFLNMFLWKTMYQNIRIKAGIEQAKKMNVMNLPFDDYLTL